MPKVTKKPNGKRIAIFGMLIMSFIIWDKNTHFFIKIMFYMAICTLYSVPYQEHHCAEGMVRKMSEAKLQKNKINLMV